MLAQNFKSPADLGLTDAQHAALCKTLVLLETGQLVHVPPGVASSAVPEFHGLFNMDDWYTHSACGTVGCIAGTAEMVGALRCGEMASIIMFETPLYNLFMGHWSEKPRRDITVPEAAQALRNYLTYGDARGEQP